MKRSLKERFERLTMPEPNTGCWIWAGSCSFGYGMISINGKLQKASRTSYTLYKGEIPTGLLACHTCDNTWCVNPDHLFLGTPRDNMIDKVKKGRHRSAKGQQNSAAKLNDILVLDIIKLRKSGLSKGKIAKSLDVSVPNVNNVIYGLTWSHITGIKYKKAKYFYQKKAKSLTTKDKWKA